MSPRELRGENLMLQLAKLFSLLFGRSRLQGGTPDGFSPPEPPGLYIHMPFCKSFCSFCPYIKAPFSQAASDGYVDLLLRELSLYNTPVFTSLYVGGGTPTADIDVLCEITERLRARINNEIAVEVHPLDASCTSLEKLKRGGVDYVSIGAQSFSEEALRHFGRNHRASDAREAVRNAVSTGFKAVDVDLVFDLAVFSPEVVMSDFTETLNMNPLQISVYPMMRFGLTGDMKKRHDWRAEATVFSVLEERAVNAGYKRSSLWTFTAEGREETYSSITRPFFLGLGISAASFDGSIFSVNTSSLEHYSRSLGEGKRPAGGHLKLKQLLSCLYYSFWALYRGRLPHEEVRRLFPKAWRMLKPLLATQRIAGNVYQDSYETKLTEKGRITFHRLEEWVTYKFIDPLWTEMKLEKNLQEGFQDIYRSLP